MKILWTLVALAVLPGCSSTRALPENAPLIGPLTLAGREGKPDYGLMVAICNRGPDKLKAKVKVTGDKKDLIQSLSGFAAPKGTYCWYRLGEIKSKRKKPIYVRIEWTRGHQQGVEKFMVSPKQTNKP